MAKVLTGAEDASAASAVTRLESIPPERRQPHGTSHRTRDATERRSRPTTSSAASGAGGAGPVGRGGTQYLSIVSVPSASTVM